MPIQASNGIARNGESAVSEPLPLVAEQPNGDQIPYTNGNSMGDQDIPVTKILSSFVANAKPAMLTPRSRDKIKEVLLDWIGVVAGGAVNAPSTDAIYKGIVSLGACSGSNTVLTMGRKYSPQYAGLLNATWGHSLDFDDTYADGTLHAGVTTIAAAFAQAESLGSACTSEDFLLAIAVGYEITCRLGRELGYESYHKGFHNTATAGIFGSVATIAVLKHLDSHTVEMAFGLAGSKAAGSMQYLENGSWNKRLHPGFMVHDAFVCVALAEAGVLGAEKIIEGKLGFLNAYSPNPNKDLKRLTRNLGTEWCWLASSLKPYAACRMTHFAIEMAGLWGEEARKSGKEVKKITIKLAKSNFILVGDPNPNKIHPQNIVDAQFSAYYQTANAWLYGGTFDLAAYNRLDDPKINVMSDRIECVVDESCSGMGGKISVDYTDGSDQAIEVRYPLGEVEHPFKQEHVEAKFLGLTTPVYGEKALKVLKKVYDIENGTVTDLLDLLQ